MNLLESQSITRPDRPVPPDSSQLGFDEARFDSGELRPHWSEALNRLQHQDSNELKDRWNTAKRILRNHGVTYNVAAREGSRERAWELDLLPLILGNEEWRQIETGIIQRAHLANLILQDIYTGPQFLLRNGLIPPALLLSNPSFLRCCRGIPVPNNTFLHLQAFDLARSPDGLWWVLDTRTQTPKGVGYVIENRTIIGRVFQDLFRDLHVEPISQFFSSIRENLVHLAPSATGWPRVVLLTPGAHSIAYYEHALLARYLGYTLVEGGDLTVRDNKVQLKTVEGPQPVDVILRQVGDAFCDPLELKSDSAMGVPGLIQTARAGKVLLANALGSGVMESPALQASLPQIARHLLQEDLHLPSAPTSWCGDPRERDQVTQTLDQLIIKHSFPTKGRRTRSGAELSEAERAELNSAIQSNPQEFIGQTPIQLSRAPVWTGEGFEGRPIVLRVYVAATRDGYRVLPGGLTKVSNSPFSPVKGFQLAGGSKDTWVLGTTETATRTGPTQLESRPAARVQTGVPSRTADNFFWMGRYAERLENLLQMLRGIVSRLVDEHEPRVQQQAIAICELLAGFGYHNNPEPFDQSLFQTEQITLDIAYNPEHPAGVHALCRRTDAIVNSVRDRFSGDAWRVLSQLRKYPGTKPTRLPMGALQLQIHELTTLLAALTGIQTENMVRGHEWHFLNIGRRLERSQNLCFLLQSMLNYKSGFDLLLNPVLEISDSSMSYRRQFYSEPEIGSVLEVLLLDELNPRALRYNVNRLLELSRRLPQDPIGFQEREHETHIRRIRRTLTPKSVAQMIVRNQAGQTIGRSTRLRRWRNQLSAFSDSLTRQYFSLLKPRGVSHELSSLPD